MAFKTIYTAYGLSKLAEAEQNTATINLTHMAVGDGSSNPTEPGEAQTQLVRERYRTTINRLYPWPGNPGRFTAEMVILVGVGGFTLREVGVFDETGTLFPSATCRKPTSPRRNWTRPSRTRSSAWSSWSSTPR